MRSTESGSEVMLRVAMGGERQMVWWGCRWLCSGGPALVHGGPARGAKTGGGDGLSIWGSIWAGGTVAGDSDKGLASGT